MVVRMRATRSHRNNRRSHHALTATRFSKCSNCGLDAKRHTVCMTCGYYRGKKVLDVTKKAVKASKKAESKKK